MTDSNTKSGLHRFLWIAIAIWAGWSMFWYGYLWEYMADRVLQGGLPWSFRAIVFIISPVALLALGSALWVFKDRWLPAVMRWLEDHTDEIDGIDKKYIGYWILLAAGLGLFVELMAIRLHGSFFQIFAYFKNISLLSCFLGLGIGFTLGHRRPIATPLVVPLLALQFIIMYAIRFDESVAWSLQNPISEEFKFGVLQSEELKHFIIVYGFIGMVFLFNAVCFVPIGHLISRLMLRQTELVAYSWNLAGSLLGILLFYFLAAVWSPPTVWLIVGVTGLSAFMVRRIYSLLPTIISAILLISIMQLPLKINQVDIYSPYQILTLITNRDALPTLQVNNIYFQRLLDLSDDPEASSDESRAVEEHYALPYRIKPTPDRVMIVGAGTGNDVASAIRHGAKAIDAAEIDPAILELGKNIHPESPYQSPRVRAYATDARAYIRETEERYDLIVYGLLDSHTLLSTASSVRLDSFVYTVEAFREARAKLKPDGVICLTFSLISPDLGHKMYLMLQEAFDGASPLVFETGYDTGHAFVVGEGIDAKGLSESTSLRNVTESFSTPGELTVDVSTDDWPFLLMPTRRYPSSYMLMLAVLMALSILMIKSMVPDASKGFSAPCFFLGAGFMLVETKGITELAVTYGGTWIVIGIVIGAILTMAFAANLLVIRIGLVRPLITYGCLIGSLLLGYFLSSSVLGGLPPTIGRLVMTLLLTLPLFFSGFAFSEELKRSASVPVALSSNLLGAMLGGFLEYNSMYLGFRALYLLAGLMYLIAFMWSLRTRS